MSESPIFIAARLINESNKEVYYKLGFIDDYGKTKEVIVPQKDILTKSGVLNFPFSAP